MIIKITFKIILKYSLTAQTKKINYDGCDFTSLNNKSVTSENKGKKYQRQKGNEDRNPSGAWSHIVAFPTVNTSLKHRRLSKVAIRRSSAESKANNVLKTSCFVLRGCVKHF